MVTRHRRETLKPSISTSRGLTAGSSDVARLVDPAVKPRDIGIIQLNIPGKTFIIGEYAVLQSSPAIVLTTTPCFSVQMQPSSSSSSQLQGIHPDSPAGRFWRSKGLSYDLIFQDPYDGLGGLGASSAQFLGAYRYACELTATPFDLKGLLEAYQCFAWQGTGAKPSGFDLIAQTSSQFVYVQGDKVLPISFKWPFPSLTFMLVHTHLKCKTHEHLNALAMPTDLSDLQHLVTQARLACVAQDDIAWIDAINGYAGVLQARGWVTESTLNLMQQFHTYPGVRAVKGCGAMGADIVLVVLDKAALPQCLARMQETGQHVLATEEMVHVWV